MPKFLIADDSETIRTVLRTFLESREGFEVCGEAVDGGMQSKKRRSFIPI
jgi:DNA-binding NarL/FixJ family response regulator